tara:strand:+ start:625 stop:1230 length:606 start_codon:yes stop_codon:yes gene_type:complete
MVQRRAIKFTGPGGNKFVNKGRDKTSAPITGPTSKTKAKTGPYTKRQDAAGNIISEAEYKKQSAGGVYQNTETPVTNKDVALRKKINKYKGGSLRARLLNIRLAGTEYVPKFKPNPDTAKAGDFGVIKKKKGTEAKPVQVRDKPKTPHSNKYMKKRIFGAKDKDKKKKITKEDKEIASGLARTEREGGFGTKTPSWEQGGY